MTDQREGETLGDYAARIAEKLRADTAERRASDAFFDAKCRVSETLVANGFDVQETAYCLKPDVTLTARGMAFELPGMAGVQLRVVGELISCVNVSLRDATNRTGSIEASAVRAIRQLMVAQREQAQKWLEANPEEAV